MDELTRELKRAIVAALHLDHVEPDDIADGAALFGEGLGLDSIDAVELVVMLEKSYGIRLSDMAQAKEAFRSVADLARFVTERRDHGASPRATS